MVAVDILNDADVTAVLTDLLYNDREDVVRIETFEEAGLMTRDAGIVIRLGNGAEFQITVQRSARADDSVHCDDCGDDFATVAALSDHLVEDHEMEPEDAQEAVA
jgi:hypothetical protein